MPARQPDFAALRIYRDLVRPWSRRRRLRLLRTIVVTVTVVVEVPRIVAGGPAAAHPSSGGHMRRTTSAAVSDPFTDPRVVGYLTAHPGMTAAVYDRRTGRTWSYRPSRRETLAS